MKGEKTTETVQQRKKKTATGVTKSEGAGTKAPAAAAAPAPAVRRTRGTDTLMGMKFEKGVVRKFMLVSLAMIVLPILTTFAVYWVLMHADAVVQLAPAHLGWLQRVAANEFVAQNQIVIGGIFGICVALIIQVSYVFVSLGEGDGNDSASQSVDKKRE